MKKLREILLIDDSRGTNSLNERLLIEMGVVEKVTIALDGSLALDYLLTKNEVDEFPSPDIIFLDINMPVMNGFQFLNEYNKLGKERQLVMVIVMINDSYSDSYMNEVKGYNAVKGCQFKPLTKEKVKGFIAQFI